MNRKYKKDRLYLELENVASRLFNEIRHTEGRFHTGVCSVKGKSVLLINNRQTIDERIVAIAAEISRAGSESLYMKPVVRAEIEKINSKESSDRISREYHGQ